MEALTPTSLPESQAYLLSGSFRSDYAISPACRKQHCRRLPQSMGCLESVSDLGICTAC